MANSERQRPKHTPLAYSIASPSSTADRCRAAPPKLSQHRRTRRGRINATRRLTHPHVLRTSLLEPDSSRSRDPRWSYSESDPECHQRSVHTRTCSQSRPRMVFCSQRLPLVTPMANSERQRLSTPRLYLLPPISSHSPQSPALLPADPPNTTTRSQLIVR